MGTLRKGDDGDSPQRTAAARTSTLEGGKDNGEGGGDVSRARTTGVLETQQACPLSWGHGGRVVRREQGPRRGHGRHRSI